MKLVFVNRFFYPDHSATSQMLSDLAFYLAAKDYEVHVIASSLNYESKEEVLLPKEEKMYGVMIHRVWSSRFGRMSLPGRMIDYVTFYFTSSWKMFSLVRTRDIVIVKTDPPMMSVIARWIAASRDAFVVNWLQDLFPEVAEVLPVRGFDGWTGKWLKGLRDRSLAKACMNVVPGKLMQQHLRNAYIESENISVIPNWANGFDIKPEKTIGDELRTDWKLSDKFVVGYSGNLGRAHEYKTLLTAAVLLKDNPEIKFLLIGGGSKMVQLESQVRKRGIENVTFKPYQPRGMLSSSLAVPDVHLTILRPDMEGLIVPSKIYGILAAGKPTIFIGDKNGEVANILRESDAGLSIEPGNAEALARKILEFSNDRIRVGQMGDNARKLFEQEYTQDSAFQKWEKLLTGTCAYSSASAEGNVEG